MPYILQAAFWVGFIGSLIGTPLAFLLGVRNSNLARDSFLLSTPVVLFLLGATSFALIYSLLPRFRMRSRFAGISAGLLTYFSFLFWLSYAVNLDTGGRTWGPWWTPFMFALLLMGWIPVSGGWFAGWLVSRLPDSPPEEKH